MATRPTPSIVTSSTAQGVDRALKSASGFDLPSLPTPDRSSDIRDILDFISYDLGPDRLAEGHWFTRKQLHAICKEFDFSYRAVLNELRRRAFVDNPLNGSLTSEDVDITPSGIIVNKSAVRAVTADLVATCPYKQRYISTRTFMPYCTERPCGEAWCLSCGPKEAEELFQWTWGKIGLLDKTYVTFCNWEPGLANRMTQRRSSLRMESVTYRRADDVVFIVSDKPHSGRTAPTSCRAASPNKAMEWFSEAIYVPGRKLVTWSDGWRPPKKQSGAFGDIDLTHLTDEQVARGQVRVPRQSRRAVRSPDRDW